MAIRKGYQYLSVMVPEDAYGTVKTAATTGVVVPDILEIKEVPEKVETTTKTLTFEPKKENALLGSCVVDANMSGPLTVLHQEFLKMLVLDSTKTTPYVIGTDQGAKYSWTLWQYFGIPAAAIKCFEASGAVLKSLKIAGSAGNPITYDAAFIAKAQQKEIAWPLAGYTPTMPADIRPFMFCKSTINAFSITKVESFDLTLTNNFIDDKAQIMNAVVRQEVVATGTEGELNLVLPYDTAQTLPALLSSTLSTITLSLIDTKTTPGSFVFTLIGHLVEAQFQDPNRGRYNNVLKFRLAGDNTNIPLSIAFTAGS